MAKGYHANRERIEAISTFGKNIGKRAGFKCEWCESKEELTEGTRLTHDFTVKYGKPSLIVQLDAVEVIKPEHVVRWIEGQFICTLNVAGPRESKCPSGIYAEAFAYLELVFALIRDAA